MRIKLDSTNYVNYDFGDYNNLIDKFLEDIESDKILNNKYLKILSESNFYTIDLWNTVKRLVFKKKWDCFYCGGNIDYNYIKNTTTDIINYYYKTLIRRIK